MAAGDAARVVHATLDGRACEDLKVTTYDGHDEEVQLKLLEGNTVFVWRRSDAFSLSGHTAEELEVARWDPSAGLLTIVPRMATSGDLEPQFDKVEELRIDADLLTGREPEQWVDENERGIGLELGCLPSGFGKIFRYGLGLRRHYRRIIQHVEDHTHCAAVRFVVAGPEGLDGPVFNIRGERFAEFKRAVDRNRERATTVAARVNVTEAHNAVAELLGLPQRKTTVGRHPVIVAMSRELTGLPVLDSEERRALVRQTSLESRAAAVEAPEEFGQLRRDIEVVSLDVLIEQFDRSMTGAAAKDESHWQHFFQTNTFALQQLFAVPIALFGEQVTVKGINALGQGSRIADFVLVNTITRTALVVEIKTPAAGLTGSIYRGAGGAEIFLPHKDLMGAVTQLQAQMESARVHLPDLLRDTPGLGPIDTVVVRGAVIAGMAQPLGAEEKASYLRFRDGLAGLEVVAFDEVRDRLRVLRDLLASGASPRAV